MDEALQAPVAGTERNTGHGHDAGLSEDTAAAGRPVLSALCSLCTSAPHPRNLQIRLWKSQVELERAFFQQSNCQRNKFWFYFNEDIIIILLQLHMYITLQNAKICPGTVHQVLAVAAQKILDDCLGGAESDPLR